MSKKRASKIRKKSKLRKPPEISKGFWLWLLQEALRTAITVAARHWLGERVGRGPAAGAGSLFLVGDPYDPAATPAPGWAARKGADTAPPNKRPLTRLEVAFSLRKLCTHN